MKTLEDELMEAADYYLGTERETAARDAAYLLRQMRKSGLSTINLYPRITSSPQEFETIVDAAITQLQEDPPEANSIFRKKKLASDLRQEMLGPSKEGKYDVDQAIREWNTFFRVFHRTNLLEEKDLREKTVSVLKKAGMWNAELERLSHNPEPMLGGLPNLPYERTRKACREYRKKELEKSRIEWEQSKQEQRKQEQN